MRDINIGKRQIITDATGKIVGTAIPSKKYPGKMAFTRYISASEVHVSVKGEQDWAMMLDRNPDWSFSPSYFTVECKLDGSEVVITLTHNCVSDWNGIYRVVHEENWQDKFLTQFRLVQTSLSRETHIANFGDLSV